MSEIWVEVPVQNADGQVVWKNQKMEMDTDKDFRIDELALERESSGIGMLLITYGELHAALRAQQYRKEDAVKRVYAEAALRIRDAAIAKGDKPTEKKVDSMITLDSEYQHALAEYSHTRGVSIQAEAWYRAQQHKSEHIRTMIYMRNTDIRNV